LIKDLTWKEIIIDLNSFDENPDAAKLLEIFVEHIG
jgi:hypothetical protein